MGLTKIQALGIAVLAGNLVNGIFIGLGLFLDDFYKDRKSMNHMSEDIVLYRYERGVVKGLFMASFIIILNSFCQIFVAVITSRKRNLKVNASIGVFLLWCAFVLCVAGLIYVGANDIVNMIVHEEGSPYGLAIAGTVTIGLTAIIAVPYLHSVLKAPSCCK